MAKLSTKDVGQGDPEDLEHSLPHNEDPEKLVNYFPRN